MKLIKYSIMFSLLMYPMHHMYGKQKIKEKEFMSVTKTIIPAAGLGTRFLPYTKTIAKEMLPLGNKPAIQFIIDEGINSGIKDFYIITSKEKTQIQDYFSSNPALEQLLEKSNKLSLLDSVKKINEQAELHFVNQPKPLGLGHAILMAQPQIGNEYFSVMLPDDISFNDDVPELANLIAIAIEHQASVIAVREVSEEKVSSYGIVAIKEEINDSTFYISRLVEKPTIDQAPSRFAIAGRYVLSPKIFESLKILESSPRKGELQLTDAIAHSLEHFGEKVIAYKFKGTLHDIGNPVGWSKAIMDMVQRKLIS